MMNRKIGSHVAMKSPDFYVGSVQEMLANHATTLMLYTGAPQNSRRVPLADLKIPEALQMCENAHLSPSCFVAHAPYLINLANSVDEEKFEMSKQFLQTEMKRTKAMAIPTLVLHPGSHVGAGKEKGIAQCIRGLNEVLDQDETGVRIAIETMAGKGNEIGVYLEDLSHILSQIHRRHQVGICLDTCHLSDAGYPVENVDAFLAIFEQFFSIDDIFVIHLNDSKNIRGSHKDRHENIGYGTIGYDTLYAWFSHPRLYDIPMILETPYVNEKSPYKKEIEMLRFHQFDAHWKDLM